MIRPDLLLEAGVGAAINQRALLAFAVFVVLLALVARALIRRQHRRKP